MCEDSGGEGPVGADVVAGVAVGEALEVVLVFGFGLPEVGGGGKLGDDFSGPFFGGVDVGDGFFGDLFLGVGGVEDGGAVGGAGVVALAVGSGGVVDLEEEFEEFAVGGEGGVEGDFDGFGVGAVVAVGGVGDVTAGVADAGGEDAGEFADEILHAPEAATGEDCAFSGGGHFLGLSWVMGLA